MFASSIDLINQTKVHNISCNVDAIFSFHACQGMLDLCMFALDSISIGNGRCWVSWMHLEWLQQAKFTSIFLNIFSRNTVGFAALLQG